jgi:hypothetical protein
MRYVANLMGYDDEDPRYCEESREVKLCTPPVAGDVIMMVEDIGDGREEGIFWKVVERHVCEDFVSLICVEDD